MEEELAQRLIAAEALVAIGVGEDVNWVERPEGSTLPAITMLDVSGPKDYTHDGPTNLQYRRIRFNVWGKSYGQAKKVARLLSSELETTHEGDNVVFEEAFQISSTDIPAERLEGGTKTFRIAMDFMVPHRPVNEGA